MPPEADASAPANLSVEDAIAHLNTIDHDDETPEVVDPAPAAAADPASEPQSEGAASAPDDAPAAAENQGVEGEEGEAGEGAENPLEPPLYWKPEAKAKFLTLDPELQAEILAQEGPRESAAAKAKDEAAHARTKAETELQGVQRFAEELGKFLPQAVQTFRSRWGDNPDWVKFAEQHGADQMGVAKAQWEQERALLQQVHQAQQVAEAKALETYVRTEFETLAKIAPDLADPKTGPAGRTEVSKYLVDQGIPAAQIQRISAVEMVLARKAMLFDRAQAKANSAPTPAQKAPPAQTRPLARGGSAPGPSDPKAKQVQAARSRFGKSFSIGDAAALLDALD